MAIPAGRPLAGMCACINRKQSVIESCPTPTAGVVTQRTSGWEAGCHVVGVRSFLVIRLVTGIAIGRRSGVTPIDVAACARHLYVGAGERE